MKKCIAILMAGFTLLLGLFTASAAAATPLKINWRTATIGVNEVYALRTNAASSTTIRWTSSNSDVATVDRNGRITGKKVGTTTVSASVNGMKADCVVTVKQAPTRISAQALTVEAGESAKMKVSLTRNSASKTLVYRSSDPKIAQVGNTGTVTGVSPGRCTITITTFNGKSFRTNVTVTAKNGSSKILVAYFSMSETTNPNNMTTEEANSTVVINGAVLGNTQYVAQIIQENTGADIFRIEPKTPYTTNHAALVELASEEQSRKARPALLANVENLDDYDVIFLGYPNWWGDMPMVLYTFLESHDLSGKTIIPFNTHGGSGFSNTIQSIAELQPNATVVRNGFTVYRDNAADCKDDVIAWLASFDLAE